MSRIAELGENNKYLINLIMEYEDSLDNYDKNLTLKGKTLDTCLKEQATWCAYYGERKVELKTLVNYLEVQIKKLRANLYVQYNENYNPSLGERAIEKYIDREPDYINMWQLLAEVQELLNKYDMILDAFNRRGFALRDLTAARIAEIQDNTL